MEPTDLYLKAKRMLALASAILLLSQTVGIDFNESKSVLPIKLSDASWVNEVFALGVFYFAVQTNLFWAAQNVEIKTQPHYKIDYYLSNALSSFSLLFWATPYINSFFNYIGNKFFSSFEDIEFWSTILTGFGAIASLLFIAKLMGELTSLVIRRNERKVRVENDLLRLLPNGSWVLVFNPVSQKAKLISFNDDGLVGQGRNHNEDHWRVRGEFLEILNSDNSVFSRFQYNEKKLIFEHTNDDDTLSIRSQQIIPEPMFAGHL